MVKLNGVYHVAAIDPASEGWRISGDDPYAEACELAVQVGGNSRTGRGANCNPASQISAADAETHERL